MSFVCPTPTRRIYPTETAAWAAIRAGTHGGTTQIPYRCACGSWHVAGRDEAMRKRAGR